MDQNLFILLQLLDLPRYSHFHSAIYELRDLEQVTSGVSDLQSPHIANGHSNTYLIQFLWGSEDLPLLGSQ